MSSLVFLALLFCLLLNVSCPFAQSVRAMEVKENPRLVEKSMLMKFLGRRSLRLRKGLFPHFEAADDFAGNGSEGGGAAARKTMSLLGEDGEEDDGEVINSHGTGDEGEGSVNEKRSGVWQDVDEKHAGFTGSTEKVELGVRHRLRLRSKRKGKGGSDRGYAGGFVAFNADYHFPRQHPPRNN